MSKEVKIYSCKHCGERFPKANLLASHVSKYHTTYIKEKCHICNKEIDNRNINQHIKSHEADVYCKTCGKRFHKAQNQINKTKNHFCSRSCSITFNNKGVVRNGKSPIIVNCKNCNTEIKYPKEYCSIKCKGEKKYNDNIEKWKTTDWNPVLKSTIPNFIRRYIEEKYELKCSECGWGKINPRMTKPLLDIHHIDGNNKNNDESNLILLCRNCHTLTPNYRTLNNKHFQN